MKTYVTNIIAIYLIAFNAYAADSNVYLSKGTAAPFTGYLITPATADKVLTLDTQVKVQTQINALMTDEQNVYAKRIDNAQKENDQLAKELESERDKSFLGKAGYFLLGVAVTGLISYGLVHTLK